MYLLRAYSYFLIYYLLYNVCNKYERIICQKLCDNVNLEKLLWSLQKLLYPLKIRKIRVYTSSVRNFSRNKRQTEIFEAATKE